MKEQAPKFVSDPQGTPQDEEVPKAKPSKTDKGTHASEALSASSDEVSLKPNPKLWPVTQVIIEGHCFKPEGTSVPESEVDSYTAVMHQGGFQYVIRA